MSSVISKASLLSQTESPSKSKNTLAFSNVPCEATPLNVCKTSDADADEPAAPAAIAKTPNPNADMSKSASIFVVFTLSELKLSTKSFHDFAKLSCKLESAAVEKLLVNELATPLPPTIKVTSIAPSAGMN